MRAAVALRLRSSGRPRNKWRDHLGIQVVRRKRCVEQRDLRWSCAGPRSFANRGENFAGARPFSGQWKQRHRPAEVASIAAARGFGERIEPRARDGTIEQRGECVSVGGVLATDDVAAVERNRRVTGVEHGGAWLASDVAPDY